MTFVRGVVMVAIQMAYSGLGFIFQNFWDAEEEALVKPHLDKITLPPNMQIWRRAAMSSLERLRPLCAGDALKTKYWEMTVDMARGLELEAFAGMHSSLCDVWYA